MGVAEGDEAREGGVRDAAEADEADGTLGGGSGGELAPAKEEGRPAVIRPLYKWRRERNQLARGYMGLRIWKELTWPSLTTAMDSRALRPAMRASMIHVSATSADICDQREFMNFAIKATMHLHRSGHLACSRVLFYVSIFLSHRYDLIVEL